MIIKGMRQALRQGSIATVMIVALLGTAHAQSLRFYGNGVNDIDRVKIRIDAPATPLDVGNDFTIELWMKALPGENGNTQCIDTAYKTWINGRILIDRSVFGPGDYGDYGVSLFSNGIAFGIGTSTSERTICSIDVDDGQWHHIVLQRRASDGRMQIYVDGALSREANGPSGDISYRDGRRTTHPADPFLVFGAEKHDANPDKFFSFHGWLDEIRISRVVRYTSSFIPSRAPYDVDASTVALYHFNEGTGDVINDVVGGNTGVRRYGGNPAGPVWTTDTPITGSPPPAEVWKARFSNVGYRVRQVFARNTNGTLGAAIQVAGAYGQLTSAYVDVGNTQTLPSCNPQSTATSGSNIYMQVTAPAVSQQGLSILGQQVTGFVFPCDQQ